MSVKRKSIVSWEEQAFAEDSRGPLGGFIWPPRSYSCSFCGREFRSAQALGGHMNVHRREKVKLNQTVNKNHNQESLEHNICDNNLVLGFDLDSCWNMGGNKRQKTNHVTQVIMDGGLDLELRLANYS